MSNQQFDLAKFDKVIADVDAVKEKGNFIPDMSTKDGYEMSKRFVLDNTAPMRKALEKAHKEVKAPFWDACKFLDSKKKELITMIEEIEAPHKLAYKNHDAEIKSKKEEAEQAVQNKIDWFDQVLNNAFNASSDQIEKMLEDCQDYEMDFDFFGKRIVEAQEKQADTISKLTDRLTQQVMFEQSEKQRIEFEEKQRDLEAREAKIIAEEQAKKEARKQEQDKAMAEFEAEQSKPAINSQDREALQEVNKPLLGDIITTAVFDKVKDVEPLKIPDGLSEELVEFSAKANLSIERSVELQSIVAKYF